jgi:probable F420-dependent oxidoreductase
VRLNGVGVWTAQLDFQPAPRLPEIAQELETLGYGSLWIGENVGREPISQAALLLGSTRRMVIATGIVNIWARDPMATLAAQLTLAEAYPDRFLLGLGVSHAHLVETIRGHQFRQPLRVMRDYLAAMDQLATRYRAVRPASAPRVLAALGPKMLHLAAEHTDGAHTYLVPPQHTVDARRLLGPGKLLVAEQAVVLETEPTRAREIARQHLRRYLPLPHYINNLRRYGFSDADFTDQGSDRLVDSLVAWGDPQTVAQRIQDHQDAGANHVCIQALDQDPRGLPVRTWRDLAAKV